jgi:hypothetical protein
VVQHGTYQITFFTLYVDDNWLFPLFEYVSSFIPFSGIYLIDLSTRKIRFKSKAKVSQISREGHEDPPRHHPS